MDYVCVDVIINHKLRGVYCSCGLLLVLRVKAAVHWVRVNALSADSSPKLTWAAMGMRADSARRL